ncbi:MAG: cysteine--tRNA ligase [Candidatus Diapherotrites archaeon CG11_big_fil_rev_8_21_14_0_20_37_9]|nr:MAG: cysteine--tRNA ligase [Candidatus Diapherotrites archaeon CG11_big_fil_rev_8_21_14_0_20_37_9]
MLKLYNTRTREIEEFWPIEKGKVKMYVCGPTVYGPGHIGHARTYTAFDFIRRYLEYSKYNVKYVVNITDVHDDMIKTANKEGITIFELANRNIKLFMKDLKELGIKEPNVMPRVTEHIKEIIAMTKTLQEKGIAYETEDGVYFAISKFPNYGKLAKIKLKKSFTGTRVETDKYDKENPMDFALWKKAKEGEPSWDSPWGKGRPGWHIECSVMSSKHLGEQIDIHGGAVDLVFPHHENEIAQSEATYGKEPFVKYWMHAGFLNVRGEKMSKSLGNFITIPELLQKYNPKAFRYFIASLHYRSRIDFNDEAIAQAQKNLDKWNNTIQELLSLEKGPENKEVATLIATARESFKKAMDEDFNLPNAWASLYDFQSRVNSIIAERVFSKDNADAILLFLKEIDFVFDFFEFKKKEEEALPQDLLNLIEEREKVRKEKNWGEADRIRDLLKEKGIELLDTPEGVKWKKT